MRAPFEITETAPPPSFPWGILVSWQKRYDNNFETCLNSCYGFLALGTLVHLPSAKCDRHNPDPMLAHPDSHMHRDPPPPETPEPLRGHAPDKGAIVLVGVKCQPALRRTILFASAASATDEMRTCAQSSLGGMGRRLRIGANGGGFGWVSQARPCRSTKAFSGTTPFLSKTPLPLQKTIMAKFSTNCSSTPYGCSNSGSVHRGATGVVGI